MLLPFTAEANILLTSVRSGVISEPFLLAVFGALLILTGDVIRQRARRNRSNESAASTPNEIVKVIAPMATRSQHRAYPVTIPAWNPQREVSNKVSNKDLPTSAQLWLPLAGGHDSNESSAEVLHH
jgi:hypothetical protein